MASILTLDLERKSVIININKITYIQFDTEEIIEPIHIPNYLEISFGNRDDNVDDISFSTNHYSFEVLKQLFEIILAMMEQSDSKHNFSKRLKITKESIEEIKSIYFINK